MDRGAQIAVAEDAVEDVIGGETEGCVLLIVEVMLPDMGNGMNVDGALMQSLDVLRPPDWTIAGSQQDQWASPVDS
ncbi:hypothetical protein ACTG9Q_32470 [Actinokineospora sp. 24-640]